MSRPARAHVDLDALRWNFSRVRGIAPGSRIMSVVKANGYGHGMTRIAAALDGSDAFGVSCLEEARALVEAGVRQPIVLLEGFFQADELDEIARAGFVTVIHHPTQLTQLEAARLPRPLDIWLKIDTGMHRLGFAPEVAAQAHARLQGLSQVASIGLMTHLACADEPANPATRAQLQRFEETVEGLPGQRSLANSGALLGWPETHADWVRPGLMLYGISPFVDTTAADHDLRPVMTLESALIAVNEFRTGEAVGYGGAWVCPQTMPVGVAAIGYGDGYPRHAGTGTPVLVDGVETQIIGRVSMDMVCIDLRPLPRAAVGSRVTLWGEGLPVETIARHAGTIPYELVCAVASRVPMHYRDGRREPPAGVDRDSVMSR